jgi:hypothetical protein
LSIFCRLLPDFAGNALSNQDGYVNDCGFSFAVKPPVS